MGVVCKGEEGRGSFWLPAIQIPFLLFHVCRNVEETPLTTVGSNSFSYFASVLVSGIKLHCKHQIRCMYCINDITSHFQKSLM